MEQMKWRSLKLWRAGQVSDPVTKSGGIPIGTVKKSARRCRANRSGSGGPHCNVGIPFPDAAENL